MNNANLPQYTKDPDDRSSGRGRGAQSALILAAMRMGRIDMNLGKRFYAALFILAFWLPLQAMDRWSALSEIESGNNDRAVGRAGEISRYQIKPKIWQRYAPEKADWEKPEESLPVVKEAMEARCKAFERSFHRPPTDFEFYILWNAPAQIRRPTKSVADRATRFSNLVSDIN